MSLLRIAHSHTDSVRSCVKFLRCVISFGDLGENVYFTGNNFLQLGRYQCIRWGTKFCDTQQ